MIIQLYNTKLKNINNTGYRVRKSFGELHHKHTWDWGLGGLLVDSDLVLLGKSLRQLQELQCHGDPKWGVIIFPTCRRSRGLSIGKIEGVAVQS